MLFKKFLSLLLISILVMSSFGSVSANSYTYPLDIYIGDTFELRNWMSNNDISSWYTKDFFDAFDGTGFFREWNSPGSIPDLNFEAIRIASGRLRVDHDIGDDDYVNYIIRPIRTELDFSSIKQDKNGIVKGSITLWAKDHWGNIRKTLPNQKLNVSFTKDKEYHDGIIMTDSSGVAHLVDLQLCLDHAGIYNVHARFDQTDRYGQFDVDTTFNSYP
ncbi:MAG: hypothetical protein LBV42_02795 [Methanobrevibacter sp.]|jgi:hypothetical protein|nr:hypothetical protein [Methanobrevibacter sp.]